MFVRFDEFIFRAGDFEQAHVKVEATFISIWIYTEFGEWVKQCASMEMAKEYLDKLFEDLKNTQEIGLLYCGSYLCNAFKMQNITITGKILIASFSDPNQHSKIGLRCDHTLFKDLYSEDVPNHEELLNSVLDGLPERQFFK